MGITNEKIYAQAVGMGAHPFHHHCLELYSCLTSACRVCAQKGVGLAALRRAVLYGMLQAAAAEAMLAVGADLSFFLKAPGELRFLAS